MLSQKYRFHSRGGVRYTYQKGKTIRTSLFSVIYAKNTRGKQRYAVVVSKKVLKSAVGRNQIRRRVYEALRLEISAFPEPVDRIFVVYNKAVVTIPFTDLRRAVRNLLERSTPVSPHRAQNKPNAH